MAETTKLVIELRLNPIDPPPVLAAGGRTSERTHHVTGPVPSPKAAMKPTRHVAESEGRSRFRPIASPRRVMASAALQYTRRLRDPVRYWISF